MKKKKQTVLRASTNEVDKTVTDRTMTDEIDETLINETDETDADNETEEKEMQFVIDINFNQ